MSSCKDCGIPTKPGVGSARCPLCWDDKCGGTPKSETAYRKYQKRMKILPGPSSLYEHGFDDGYRQCLQDMFDE